MTKFLRNQDERQDDTTFKRSADCEYDILTRREHILQQELTV